MIRIGRPPLPKKRRRTANVMVRLTTKDKRALDRYASKQDQSTAEAAHHLIVCALNIATAAQDAAATRTG